MNHVNKIKRAHKLQTAATQRPLSQAQTHREKIMTAFSISSRNILSEGTRTTNEPIRESQGRGFGYSC